MPNRLKKRESCEIAIVGGGPAGSLAAVHLAKAGFQVVLFEKEKKPVARVYNEYLSAECLPLLQEVGLNPVSLGGVELTHFRLHGPRQTVEARLPRRSVGLSRVALSEELLRLAKEAGADVRRGVEVEEVVEGLDSPSGSILIATTVGEMRAQRLIVATGNSDFKSANERVGRDENYVGFQIHLKLMPSAHAKLKKSSDLFVFDYGYGVLSPIEDGLVNFCFLIKKSIVKTIGNDWDSLTSHIGASCWPASHYLAGAEPVEKEFAVLEHVPLGFLRRDPPPAGLFFVGDQLAVMPSLMGDELSVSLSTARAAVEAVIERSDTQVELRFAQEASRAYQKAMRKTLRLQLDASYALHRLFKKPNLVDLSAFAFRAFPSLFTQVYKSTRVSLTKPTRRASLTSRGAAALKTSVSTRS